MTKEINTYDEFWDFYVAEHSKPMTRYLHFAGTALGIALLAFLIWKGLYLYIPACFVIGYGFSWFGHFAIEKNKPATFKHPFWSFISDYKMMYMMVTGKMESEVARVTADA